MSSSYEAQISKLNAKAKKIKSQKGKEKGNKVAERIVGETAQFRDMNKSIMIDIKALMKKTKTNRKFIAIFSAIIGVVFAFMTGVTYCAVDLTLGYGSRQTTTKAYMANQQYQVINDTLENPISFSSGSHNFEIALQNPI